MNYLHSFKTENELKSQEKVCNSKVFCGIVMPSPKNNMLKFDKYMKSDKMLCIIYTNLESLIKDVDGCASNPEKYSTTKIGEHVPCEYLMSTIWAFGSIQNKHSLYHGKDYMNKFCNSRREHATNVINFEKKKMLPLTKKELKLHQHVTTCSICKKIF